MRTPNVPNQSKPQGKEITTTPMGRTPTFTAKPPGSAFTSQQIEMIRRMYSRDGWTHQRIAEHFKVTRPVITRLLSQR